MQLKTFQELSRLEKFCDHPYASPFITWVSELLFLSDIGVTGDRSIINHLFQACLSDNFEELKEELVLVDGLLREHAQVIFELSLIGLRSAHHLFHRHILLVAISLRPQRLCRL